jgi:succinoglycan biosynthesis transport protein ExoP
MTNPVSNNALSGSPEGLPPFTRRRVESSSAGTHLNIDVVGSFKRHWLISVSVFLVLLGCGGFVLWKKDKPVYSAFSVVYVSPKFPKILTGDNEVDDRPYDSYFADQMLKLSRHDIIEDAITRLPYSVRGRTGPPLPYEIQVLQQTLEAGRIGATYEMFIKLSGPSPSNLAEIVNSVTDSYVEKAKNEEFFGLDARLTTLHQEQDKLQQQMDDRLGEQAQLMKELGVATISSAEGAANPYDSTLQAVRAQLAGASMERQAAEARYGAMLKGDGAGESTPLDAAAEDAIAVDVGLSAMRSNLNNRRAVLVEETSGMRPDNPIYKKDAEEIASIDGQMKELQHKAADRLQNKLRQDVARTRMVELQLIKELGDKTHAATTAAPKVQRAAELGPEIGSLQRAYDAIDDRIRELELESSSPGTIHMSTRAQTPLGPEKTKLKTYLLLLIVVSLTCAMTTPVGLDLMDGRIYTPRDVEGVVGFHPFGVLLDDEEFRREISGEYYFRLAAGVDHAVRNAGVRTFLFTSPAHGSGTSTVVRKLSEKLRGLNLSTRTIIASGPEGLAFSRDFVSRTDHLLQSSIKTDNIQTSPALPLVAVHDGLGASDRPEEPVTNTMARALHQASERCDVVLIDASPLPISANTEYLARLADVTVLVAKSGMTTKQELDRAARLLERLDVSGVAVILNKMGQDRADRALKKEFNRYEQSISKRFSSAEKSSRRRRKTRA